MNLQSLTQVNYNDPFPLILKKVVPLVTPKEPEIPHFEQPIKLAGTAQFTSSDLPGLQRAGFGQQLDTIARNKQKLERHAANYGTEAAYRQIIEGSAEVMWRYYQELEKWLLDASGLEPWYAAACQLSTQVLEYHMLLRSPNCNHRQSYEGFLRLREQLTVAAQAGMPREWCGSIAPKTVAQIYAMVNEKPLAGANRLLEIYRSAVEAEMQKKATEQKEPMNWAYWASSSSKK